MEKSGKDTRGWMARIGALSETIGVNRIQGPWKGSFVRLEV
jgi:hypothetical protein